MMTDPIADMLTRIRNAGMVRHQTVTMPLSKIKRHIAEILQAEGYIKGFDVQTEEGKPFSNLVLHLKYGSDRKPIITGLKRVSRPGLRVYTKRDDIPRVRSGLGLSIISTPKGLMTGDAAWKEGIGGEVVCFVW